MAMNRSGPHGSIATTLAHSFLYKLFLKVSLQLPIYSFLLALTTGGYAVRPL